MALGHSGKRKSGAQQGWPCCAPLCVDSLIAAGPIAAMRLAAVQRLGWWTELLIDVGIMPQIVQIVKST